jgi:hypothetical protein
MPLVSDWGVSNHFFLSDPAEMKNQPAVTFASFTSLSVSEKSSKSLAPQKLFLEK